MESHQVVNIWVRIHPCMYIYRFVIDKNLDPYNVHTHSLYDNKIKRYTNF